MVSLFSRTDKNEVGKIMSKWTNEEIEVLKCNLHLTNVGLTTILDNKDISSIKYKCKTLGLRKKTKFRKFLPEDVQKLENNRELTERITGHLLGDGSLNSDISFTLRNTHKDYIIQLQEFFNMITDRKNKFTTIPPYTTNIKSVSTLCKKSFAVTLTCAPLFRPLKKIWYRDGKVIPRNISLTPLVCNRWYCDDGNLYIDKSKGNARITLHTDAFHESDVEFLVTLLSKYVNISSHKKQRKGQNKQFVITIQGEGILTFLEYIDEPPVESFNYKWDIKSYKKQTGYCKFCLEVFKYGSFKPYRKICNKCKFKMVDNE